MKIKSVNIMLKRHFFLFILSLTTISMSAQIQQTFLYEITLFDRYKHKSMWTEREHNIQKEHIAYLDIVFSLRPHGLVYVSIK